MNRNSKNLIFVHISFVLLVSILLWLPIDLNYKIQTKGLILPAYEWSLTRTVDGNLISAYKDNIKGTVNNLGVTEFRRGDVVEFQLNPGIANSLIVNQGDTIGRISSNEEERNLIQLLGQFEILNAELEFYSTGKKPEDIQEAQRKLELVIQDYETQKKLTSRAEVLFHDRVISDQNYDIALNDLRLKEIRKNIAEAQYLSAITGDKPEMVALIIAKRDALQKQIAQVQNRINYFTLISPVSGMIVSNRGLSNHEVVINIADTSSYVVLVPFQLIDKDYVKIGQEVEIILNKVKERPRGKIIKIDNVVQMVDYKQTLFATVQFNNKTPLIPGSFAEITILSDEIPLLEYFKRFFQINI
jgi:multidrug efflux pump subunit AcrA (membrane-fusion protein)